MTRFIRKTNLLMQFKEVNLPIGATYLCKRLDVPQATVGRMLTQMEKDGLLEKSVFFFAVFCGRNRNLR